ncbi:hypothetical protein ES703_52642 [subsurface metagenome]
MDDVVVLDRGRDEPDANVVGHADVVLRVHRQDVVERVLGPVVYYHRLEVVPFGVLPVANLEGVGRGVLRSHVQPNTNVI